MLKFSSFFSALFLFASGAAAQVPDDVVRAEILPGWRTEDGMHHAGLKLTLKPGWKTYWRAPGDAGIPPLFDWAGSINMRTASVQFPTPALFDQAGVLTVGYEKEVIFPMHITTVAQDAPVVMNLRVDLGVCEEICVPVTLAVSATLRADGAEDTELGRAMDSRPAPGAPITCEISPISDGLTLVARGQGVADHVVIEAGAPDIWVSAASVEQGGGVLTATVDMVPPDGAPFALDRSAVRMTVFAGGDVLETVGCD